MPTTEPWTIGRLLQWTSDFLRKHGSSSPRLDAEVLLAETLGKPRIALYTSFEEDPGDELRSRFRELVRRRAAGEPVAYLVGHREFFSLPFAVTPDVLIPRPETEFVVITLLDAAKQFASLDRPFEIADVGTGSGIIAVCAAKHLSQARVTATDISEAALNVARRNAETHGVADRIEFLAADLLADLPPDRQFDLVASNPPYIRESELDEISREVKDHEPRQALVSGPNGDEVIVRLVPQAGERLRPGGLLIVEISPMLATRVHQLIERDGRFDVPSTQKDLAGLPRVVSAGKKTE
jgi:release factor glutamine methyltransferase